MNCKIKSNNYQSFINHLGRIKVGSNTQILKYLSHSKNKITKVFDFQKNTKTVEKVFSFNFFFSGLLPF